MIEVKLFAFARFERGLVSCSMLPAGRGVTRGLRSGIGCVVKRKIGEAERKT